MCVLESKSTGDITKTHNENISKAYNDLKQKIETNVGNNPWENAKNHMENINIMKKQSLLNTITQLSNDYLDNVKHTIEEFNVIPSSTIFLEDKWFSIDHNELQPKLEGLIKTYSAKSITILCVNKKSINDFISFINE